MRVNGWQGSDICAIELVAWRNRKEFSMRRLIGIRCGGIWWNSAQSGGATLVPCTSSSWECRCGHSVEDLTSLLAVCHFMRRWGWLIRTFTPKCLSLSTSGLDLMKLRSFSVTWPCKCVVGTTWISTLGNLSPKDSLNALIHGPRELLLIAAGLAKWTTPVQYVWTVSRAGIIGSMTMWCTIVNQEDAVTVEIGLLGKIQVSAPFISVCMWEMLFSNLSSRE